MNPLVTIIDLLVNFYFILLLARVLFPLFGFDPYHPIMQWVFRLTEPILAPIRSVLPRTGMIDFGPMVAMILLGIIQTILTAILT